MTARKAYRSTFEEYRRKLDALQRLMSSGSDTSSARAAVEEAGAAHSRARDELARQMAIARHSASRSGKTVAAGC